MAPRLRARLAVAVAVGVAAALLTLWSSARSPNAVTDFDQTWFAARAILAGRDPYALIGPGRAFDWPWAWAYPLPAGIVAAPLACLEVGPARAVFNAIGGAMLAFALTSRSWVPLTVLASSPFLIALSTVQWSPYVAAGMLLPALGGVIAVKPNLGLAAFAGTRRLEPALIGALALVAVATFVQPQWITEWRAAVASIPGANYTPYVMRPGGFLLLLAAFRWRQPAARVLLAMALLPSTPAAYDALVPLAAVVALGAVSLRVALLLSLCSFGVVPFLASWLAFPSFGAYAERQALVSLGALYLPMLAAVLSSALRDPLEHEPRDPEQQP